MGQRRKLKHELRRMDETRNILDAIKNLALLEINKLEKRVQNQHLLVNDLERIAVDFLSYHDYSFPSDIEHRNIWILFGSERGLCGDFNGSIIEYINGPGGNVRENNTAIIAVGNKLCSRLEGDPDINYYLEGADVIEEVTLILNNIINHVNKLQKKHKIDNVQVLFHRADTGQLECSQLIPPFKQLSNNDITFSHPPIMNIAPADFFSVLVEQYLFNALHEIAYTSMMSENHKRLQHMTGSIQKIDERIEEITHRYHIYRQQEITEEIEVILLNAISFENTIAARHSRENGNPV